MFDTRRVPVRVFKSADVDAPQLNFDSTGLKTVLKACLVTGYGTGIDEKKALGWEMPFETGTKAVFRSKSPSATGCCLCIDETGLQRSAKVCAYRRMSDVDTGDGQFGIVSNNPLPFGYIPNLKTASAQWWLIGYAKAFVFIVRHPNENNTNVLYFGDFPSLVAADMGNCVCVTTQRLNYDYMRPDGFSSTTCQAALGYLKTEKADLTLQHLFQGITGVAYPDVITGGFAAAEVYLRESSVMRGLWSGIYKVQHNLSTIDNGNEVEINGQRFIKFNISSNRGIHDEYLIALDEWEVV